MNQQHKVAVAKTERPGSEPETTSIFIVSDETTAALDIASRCALIGMFLIAIIAAFYFGRSILMPVLAGLIVGITLSPLQKLAEKYHIPAIFPAVALVALLIGGLWVAIVLMAGPLTDWINKAPEIGIAIREKVRLFERPLGMLRELQSAIMGPGEGGTAAAAPAGTNITAIAQQTLMVLTPALTELVIFFGTMLFFLVGINRMRRKLIAFFETRDARRTVLRIWNDVEQNLITYLSTVTIINICLGAATALMLWVLGFPNPIAFGVLIAVLNYMPYIGSAIFALILFVVGLISEPSIGAALLAPALFVCLTTIEGQIIMPNIVGHRLTLPPFLVFLALAFWAWLWGPLGAFLATPILIVGLAVLAHLFPREGTTIPG